MPVDVRNLNAEHFRAIIEEADYKAYQAVVYAKALKHWVRVVVVHYFDQECLNQITKLTNHQEASSHNT